MKTLRYIGMALLAVVLCVNFAACSDDDEDDVQTLSGTTWKIVSSDDEDMEGTSGATVAFKTDGTVKFNPDAGWNYARWTLNGNTLKIVLGEQNADDYIEGQISVNGNMATYRYHWADCDGEWEDTEYYTMTLQKQ